jgi:FtsZ-interacting cell division protein ZipA
MDCYEAAEYLVLTLIIMLGIAVIAGIAFGVFKYLKKRKAAKNQTSVQQLASLDYDASSSVPQRVDNNFEYDLERTNNEAPSGVNSPAMIPLKAKPFDKD